MVDLSSLSAFRRRPASGFDHADSVSLLAEHEPSASSHWSSVPVVAAEEVSASYGCLSDLEALREFAPLDDEIQVSQNAAPVIEPADEVSQQSALKPAEGRCLQSTHVAAIKTTRDASFSDRTAPVSPHVPFMPKPGPGVTIRAPAIEVSAKEYDAHLDRLIAEAGTGGAGRLIAIKRKGSVVPRGEDWIFTRGRA